MPAEKAAPVPPKKAALVPPKKAVTMPAKKAAVALKIRTKTPPHLLALPPELRNQIYLAVLCLDKANGKIRIKQRQSDKVYAKLNTLAILQTCRKVHEEAAGIFYFHNHLHFSGGGKHFLSFFTSVSPTRTSNIRQLTIRYDSGWDDKHYSERDGTTLVKECVLAGWRSLHFLPHLSVLHLEVSLYDVGKTDSYRVGVWDGPAYHGHSLETAFKQLRGLDSFKVVVETQPGRASSRHLSASFAHLRRLEKEICLLVVRRKLFHVAA